jgi:hypothetical protein
MLQDVILSKKLKGRFAIVKLWPELKTAEDECIARLKIAATALNLECLEIYSDGSIPSQSNRKIKKDDVDFVLHLHYDTPKLYDAFSFVALWNPLQLYHQWGYTRCSRNLLSHDDFISCSSDPADHHLARLVKKSVSHLPPLFTIYHSLSEIMYSPTLGEQKLFYIGINWDVLNGGVSRHQELLKWLDITGELKIYGPHLFQGVKVWNGYKSYIKEIPFDGVSVLNEIHKAGISLVLSSQMHKQSQLMSSRLFESIAAGALVICDENEFAKNFFGDALLYIDTRSPVEEIGRAILTHLNWAKQNPQSVLAMINKAQLIFKNKFSLKKNLYDLYNGFSDRKLILDAMKYPTQSNKIKISVNFLMPEYDEKILESHIASITVQDYPHFSPALVMDREDAIKNRKSLDILIAKSSVAITVLTIDYFSHRATQKKRNTGEIIAQVLENIRKGHDAVIFVAPNENLFSNHLYILAGSLARNPNIGVSATAAIIKHHESLHGNHETIDFRQLDPLFPVGYGRFIFRISMLPKDLHLALPYLDRKALAALIGENTISQEIPATVIIQTDSFFPAGQWDEGQENELLTSFCPSVFTIYPGFEIKLPVLSYVIPMKKKKYKYIKWIIVQIIALRKQGLSMRIRALKRKIKYFAVS